MKSITKFLFVMVALATALAFVSCSNDDNDSDDGVVAVYKSSSSYYTMTFFDDYTWTMDIKEEGETRKYSAGTYEGDPSQDGELKCKMTKVANGEGGLMDVQYPDLSIYNYDLEIKNGETNFGGITIIRQ
ncbi:MAG: hypothetical protein HDR51_04510 [Treponema sp.]|nr:hypothetical protein [Treponema sp.]